MRYGAEQVLQREYGDFVCPVESGYDFSVLIDLESLPESQGKPFRFLYSLYIHPLFK